MFNTIKNKTLLVLAHALMLTINMPVLGQQNADLSTVSALQTETAVERLLQAGARHSYLINLKKSQTLRAAIDQLGIDVVVMVYSPDKSPLYEIDSPENDWGREYIEIRATKAGIYRLEISSLKKSGICGRYRISVATVTPSEKYENRR